MAESWIDVGAVADLSKIPLQPITVGKSPVALSYKDGVFGAVSNVCNHVGGPLGEGRLDGDFIVCHWHGWEFDRKTGVGEPGYEEDRVPSFPVKVEGGRVLIDLAGATKRNLKPHPAHPLARPVERSGRKAHPV
jgi:nitrite reductase/ring-hydroxylating ferredoxin subunit